jgi:Cof subfamily protein (haloacid dehalogenase superfamily)
VRNHRIRLIASDLDGTLLRGDKTISARTSAAIGAARAAGLFVLAATGRQVTQVPAEVEAAGITHTVGSNGAIAIELPSRRVLFEELLDPSAMATIVDFLRAEVPEARVSAVRDHGARHAAAPGYSDLLTPMERDRGWWQIDTEPLADVIGEPTLKLTVRHPRLSAEQLRTVLAGSGLSGFHATTSGAPFLEVGAAGVTKATGVARLCELLGVDASQVLAAGDARNDLELIGWAGVGVAVGNADSMTIGAADWVTASNEQDGVALAIETALAQENRHEPVG